MWLQLIFMCILACSSSLTTSFDLSGVLSGNRMGGVPLGISLSNGELDVEGICSEPGMACQNCTHAVTCVALPYGWLKLPLQECTEGFTCNAHEQTCSENPVPECGADSQKYTHTCEQVGIFPDAYDCRKFHLCSPPEDLPDGRPAEHRTALCPRHYAYNSQTAQCSIRLNHGQCDFKPVPDCKNIGQSDALPHSPNHYYVCLVKQGYLYPQVFICPHGWYFWDGFCRPEPIRQNPGASNGNDEQFQHDKSEDNNSEDPRSGRAFIETTNKRENPTKRFEENGKDSDEKYGIRDSSKQFGFRNSDSSERNNRRKESTEDSNLNDPKKNERSTEIRKDSEENKPKATTSRIDSFFSTERTVTYAADTFLADKFDLTQYESTDDVAPSVDEFTNSFESEDEFW